MLKLSEYQRRDSHKKPDNENASVKFFLVQNTTTGNYFNCYISGSEIGIYSVAEDNLKLEPGFFDSDDTSYYGIEEFVINCDMALSTQEAYTDSAQSGVLTPL